MISNNEGIGWVIKAPFTTNSGYIRFARSENEVFKKLRTACNDLYNNIHYVIIQPCMLNRKEHKLVFVNEQPLYFASIGSNSKKSKGGRSLSFINSSDKMDRAVEFASNSINKLKIRFPNAITDGLLRVDMFQTADGRLVVNEFESLEARYDSANHKHEIDVAARLVEYWKTKLETILASYIEKHF